MAAWTQTITLTEPAGLGPLATGISDLATAAGATLDAAGVHALHVSGVCGNALLKDELLGVAGAPRFEPSLCAGVCSVGVEGGLAGLSAAGCDSVFRELQAARKGGVGGRREATMASMCLVVALCLMLFIANRDYSGADSGN